MSKHYLIDANTAGANAAAIRATSQINEIRIAKPIPGITTRNGSLVNGNFVVRVDDDVLIQDPPTDLDDLLNQKYAGILAKYPGYTNIEYDEILDNAKLVHNTSFGTWVGAVPGMRGNTSMSGFSELNTTTTVVVPTVTSAVILLELYSYVNVDNRDTPFKRYYEERLSTDLGCFFSADGGATWSSSVTPGAVTTAPVPGTDLKLRFFLPVTGNLSKRVYLGSWAIIF